MNIVELNPEKREYNGEMGVTGTVTFGKWTNDWSFTNASGAETQVRNMNVSFIAPTGEEVVAHSARVMGKAIDNLQDVSEGDVLFVSLESYEGRLQINALSISGGNSASVDDLGLADMFAGAAETVEAEGVDSELTL